MTHFFDVEIAKILGVDGAIMVENLRYWIRYNQANQKHFYEGKTWTYNSNRAFIELFPYYSSKQIRTILEKLESKGVLLKGNFNQKGYDRTSWYSFVDESWITETGKSICPKRQMDLPEKTNGFARKGGAIPILNTVKITNNKKGHLPFNPILTEGIILPWETESFKIAWLRWKKYKYDQHQFKFKSTDSEQQSLMTLSNDCDGLEDVAIHSISNAIASGWKKVYKNKRNERNSTNNTLRGDVQDEFNRRHGGEQPSGS